MPPAAETTLTIRSSAPLETRLHDYAVTIPPVCDSEETLKLLENIGNGEKALIKEIEKFFDEDISRAHQLHKSLTTKKKTFLAGPEGRLERCRQIGQVWVNKKRQLAIEEERARHEELRRQQAEQERLRREAEEKAKPPVLDVRAMFDEPEEPVVLPPAPPPVILAPSVGKTMDVKTVKQWTFRVTDKLAFLEHCLRDVSLFALLLPIKPTLQLVQAIVEDTLPGMEIGIDESKMKALIREQKEKFAIPGIEALQEERF